MKPLIPSLFCCCLVSFLPCCVLAQTQTPAQYENPRTARASDVLPARLRSGPGWKVAPAVRNDGYLNLYSLSSVYGDYQVHGTKTLEIRVQEMAALKTLEQFTESKVFIDAAKKSGVDVLTAPIRTITTLVEAVQDPAGTIDTVSKVPQGALRLFRNIASQVQSGAQKVSQAVTQQQDPEESELTSKVVAEGKKQALIYSGYSEREGNWYKKVGVDPYTTNIPLRDKISRIALVDASVSLGARFIPGVVDLGLLGKTGSVLTQAKKISVYAPPEDLKAANKDQLLKMGIKSETIENFLGNESMSPSIKTLIVQLLTELDGVQDRGAMLEGAALARSEAGALVFYESAEYAVRYHRRHERFVSFLGKSRVPAGVTKSGTVIMPLPLDSVVWTKEFEQIFTGLRKRVTDENRRISRIELHFFGPVSPVCRTNLERSGLVVREMPPGRRAAPG